MNLSLYQLKKNLKLNKQAQGSLIAIVLGGVVLSTILSSVTAWYLSMNKTMSGTNDQLEAMTIAMSEWQRLEHMSLEELEDNRENYKNPYNVGDKFKVGINLGEQGFFDEGKCNSLTGPYAGEYATCFKDTIMTVYDKDDNAMYTTRSLPLSVSHYVPEGTILPYTGDLAKIPHGWALCDGTNGTPDLRGRFLEGVTSGIRQFHSAGIPNISGVFGNTEEGGAIINGAFYVYNSTSNIGAAGADQVRALALNEILHYRLEGDKESGYRLVESHIPWGSDGGRNIGFNASRSNSIYGNSSTVQPNSYTVYYIMKIR